MVQKYQLTVSKSYTRAMSKSRAIFPRQRFFSRQRQSFPAQNFVFMELGSIRHGPGHSMYYKRWGRIFRLRTFTKSVVNQLAMCLYVPARYMGLNSMVS